MEVEGFNRNTTPCGSYGSSALDFVLGVEGEKHDASGREAVKRALTTLGVNVNATNTGSGEPRCGSSAVWERVATSSSFSLISALT